MSTDIKLSKAKLAKIIPSGRILGKTLSNVVRTSDKIVLTDLDVTLDKDVLPKLATKATSFALDKCEGQIRERRAVRSESIHFY